MLERSICLNLSKWFLALIYFVHVLLVQLLIEFIVLCFYVYYAFCVLSPIVTLTAVTNYLL